jgi:hypothetical protein
LPEACIYGSCIHCGWPIRRVWVLSGWSPWMHFGAARTSVFCKLDKHRSYHPGVTNVAEPELVWPTA